VDCYFLVKTLHVLIATGLFGTGAGIAFFMLKCRLGGVPGARRFAASTTVQADVLFTLPAVIVQPVSSAWLVWRESFDWTGRWLIFICALYLMVAKSSW
jgi:uncharacterized membrane protein